MLRTVLAILAGIVSGGILNMVLVNLGPRVIPPPEGVDITSFEGLAASMPMFAPRHFLFPFLGHALGTLAGAWIAARLAARRPEVASGIVGIFFLSGGIFNVIMLPSPLWFTLCDLLVAYLPMAWLGWRMGRR